MRIYRGKLNWDNQAINEALTIILPSNIDIGELVCAYWQWTTDPKKPESLLGTINRVTTTANNEKNIRFFHGQPYRFDAVLGPDAETLDITMSNTSGDNTSTTVHLSYSDSSPASEDSSLYHVYVGTLNWYWYAVDEMVTVVVLSSFKQGDQVCVYWQWTVNANGVLKVNADSLGVIDTAEVTETGRRIGFLYDAYYKFDGDVSEDGDTMSLTMRNANGDKSDPITLRLSSEVL